MDAKLKNTSDVKIQIPENVQEPKVLDFQYSKFSTDSSNHEIATSKRRWIANSQIGANLSMCKDLQRNYS